MFVNSAQPSLRNSLFPASLAISRIMLIFVLVAAILTTTLSAPVAVHNDIDSFVPFTLFGRDIPPCMDIRRYRTKQDIIWSCLATIFACTWVAIHPNVPDQRHSEWKKFRTRVLSMLYALIAPEIVTMWAMRQRIGAARHVEQYNKKFFPALTPKSWVKSIEEWFSQPAPRTDGRWTLAHGFLLEMHGLYWHKGGELLRVYELYKPIEILEEEIADKSKGDFLTKLVVVLQTTWFIVQCLARWATHLPVTELEVVTFAFAVLNIITYILWWNKPQSMQVPIWVREDDDVEFRQGSRSLVEETRKKVEDEMGKDSTAHGDAPGVWKLMYCMGRWMRHFASGIKQWTTDAVNEWGTFYQLVIRGICYSISTAGTKLAKFAGKRADLDSWLTCLSSILWWSILSIRYCLIPIITMIGGSNDPIAYYAFYSTEDGFSSPKTIFPTFIISGIFGGLHLIPVWTVTFQSSGERLLWQISSFCITVTPVFLVIEWLLNKRVYSRFLKDVLPIVTIVIGGLYGLARIALLIIACTTLRNIPDDTYRNVEWTTLLPHF